MVVTRSCKSCGDTLVIETNVVGLSKPLLISSMPTALGPEEGNGSLDLDGHTAADAVKELYGLVAVPQDFTRPAWVVNQFTTLGQLDGHKLHHVHKCPETGERDGDWYAVQEANAKEPVAA